MDEFTLEKETLHHVQHHKFNNCMKACRKNWIGWWFCFCSHSHKALKTGSSSQKRSSSQNWIVFPKAINTYCCYQVWSTIKIKQLMDKKKLLIWRACWAAQCANCSTFGDADILGLHYLRWWPMVHAPLSRHTWNKISGIKLKARTSDKQAWWDEQVGSSPTGRQVPSFPCYICHAKQQQRTDKTQLL